MKPRRDHSQVKIATAHLAKVARRSLAEAHTCDAAVVVGGGLGRVEKICAFGVCGQRAERVR